MIHMIGCTNPCRSHHLHCDFLGVTDPGSTTRHLACASLGSIQMGYSVYLAAMPFPDIPLSSLALPPVLFPIRLELLNGGPLLIINSGNEFQLNILISKANFKPFFNSA